MKLTKRIKQLLFGLVWSDGIITTILCIVKPRNVYEQLIDDYHESYKYGVLFGRIISFIFDRLPNNEKNLYLEIRKDNTLSELAILLSEDWVNCTNLRSDKLIEQARRRRRETAWRLRR